MRAGLPGVIAWLALPSRATVTPCTTRRTGRGAGGGRNGGRRSKTARTGLLPALVLTAGGAWAGETTVTVAVAANAAEAVEALAADFERETGHGVVVTAGSTGKLYAQILHGAPFDMFLAADRERPRLLVEQGLAVEDSRRTYAIGRLVLWTADPTVAVDADTLSTAAFRRLALANPDLAPYGAAARETLRKLGLWDSLRPKIVLGENVGQAFAMTASGNAELGLVARSSVLRPRNGRAGSSWNVPADLHTPIRQDAVLLKRAERSEAAQAFQVFLHSPSALETIESFGFALVSQADLLKRRRLHERGQQRRGEQPPVAEGAGRLDHGQPRRGPEAPAQGTVGKRRPGSSSNP